MTPEQFLNRCKTICHVGPAGVWEQISRYGFRTAEQLILEADLTDEERQRLLSEPRQKAVQLQVHGQVVTLRDQGPLFARKDLKSVLDSGLDMSDWIHLLNRRVYFFTDQTSMQKLLEKYVQEEGAQDVVWLSPLKLLETEGLQLEPHEPEHGLDRPPERASEHGGDVRTAFPVSRPKARRSHRARRVR